MSKRKRERRDLARNRSIDEQRALNQGRALRRTIALQRKIPRLTRQLDATTARAASAMLDFAVRIVNAAGHTVVRNQAEEVSHAAEN